LVCSSRIALDPHGRVIAVATTSAPDVEIGRRWILIGNSGRAGERGFEWMGRSGRKPTARERPEARPPYESRQKTASWERRTAEREQVPDEHLADAEAIRLARLEQQRQPADLLQAVAA
jgi:hypothetical protein